MRGLSLARYVSDMMRMVLFNLKLAALCTLEVVGAMRGILVAVATSEGIAGATLVRGVLVAVAASEGIAGVTSGGLLVLRFLVSYTRSLQKIVVPLALRVASWLFVSDSLILIQINLNIVPHHHSESDPQQLEIYIHIQFLTQYQ